MTSVRDLIRRNRPRFVINHEPLSVTGAMTTLDIHDSFTVTDDLNTQRVLGRTMVTVYDSTGPINGLSDRDFAMYQMTIASGLVPVTLTAVSSDALPFPPAYQKFLQGTYRLSFDHRLTVWGHPVELRQVAFLVVVTARRQGGGLRANPGMVWLPAAVIVAPPP